MVATWRQSEKANAGLSEQVFKTAGANDVFESVYSAFMDRLTRHWT